ncbi:hypothetical protein E4U17_006384 [Claviceps sp. LM77 group G4]|nr:hypothetical protein E4U17_006384 [Claviceps sp. LM77 group G4]KAG6085256.1 hypothetical protein E4U16_006847 [Claviceps sp. LM84 group G4]KAG6086098.1 hypothetical protein E4U33_000096 [Claviceps sp. LM78 group G4]
MVSPDVFLCSPSRRSKQYVVPSSSPDLPSIQDLLSRDARRPPTKSAGKAAQIADTKTSSFSGPRELWRSAQAAKINQISSSHDSSLLVIEDNGAPTTSVDLASKSQTPPRRRRRSNEELVREAGQQEKRTDGATTSKTAQPPWKKFKSETPEKKAARSPRSLEPARLESMPCAADVALVDDADQACSPIQGSLLPAQSGTRLWGSQDSLQLESAMTRRKDWTPPRQTTTTTTTTTNADLLESSAAVDPIDLEEDANTASFETLLTAYKLRDGLTVESESQQSDGLAPKKRKTDAQPVLTSLVPPLPIIASTVAKKKVSRAKPRTITAIATAAYKQATQIDSQNAAVEETKDAPFEYQQNAVRKEAKSKSRKQPAKPKKMQPPKPILFSPETALKQVAQQDFVFGTSSQLAREQSPTFLRDLQRAMKSSNQLDEVRYTTPLNSDTIEPPECRPKLWDAAARDADGDVFDVEVINLTESDACAPHTPERDPFGYCKGDVSVNTQPRTASEQAIDVSSTDIDGFVDLSDILPASPKAAHDVPETAPETLEIGHMPTGPSSPECKERSHPEAALISCDEASKANMLPNVPRPIFEDYTDAQLSTEVSRYGFKPIKRRSAMVTLLEQCWQQKMGNNGYQIRTQSTAAQVPKPTTSSLTKRPRGRPRKGSINHGQAQDAPPSAQVAESPKRPRGRPRKDSVSKNQAQNPSPSAQAAESPKRPRGRPRKDSINNGQARDPTPSAQVVESPKRPRGRPRKDSIDSEKSQDLSPSVQVSELLKQLRGRSRKDTPSRIGKTPAETTTRKRKATSPKAKKDAEKSLSITNPLKRTTISKRKATSPKAKKVKKVIEISDSESDSGDSLSSFPSSSGSTSSSPRHDADATMSFGEDTELSLALTFTASDKTLFEYITRAITTASRTSVPTEPSWHEKILLYDPIVLEDLTAWLNNGQLTRVGYNKDIRPAQLKNWCDSKSICCLWKTTWKGSERKRL